MRRKQLLTLRIAKLFLADSNSIDLSKYTEIADAAAEQLSKHDDALDLSGLTALSANAAKQLGSHRGRELRLSSIKFLSSEAVGYLRSYCGNLDLDFDSVNPDFDNMQELAEYCNTCSPVLSENDDEEHNNEDEDEFAYVDDLPRPERADPPRTITNSIGMKLVPIAAGTFIMAENEQQHDVTITKDFYLGMTQVTQAQYQQVIGENPSEHQGDYVSGRDSSEFPVEKVSWFGAMEFCKRLSELPAEKKAGRAYRLPTEAEWEYACRAGSGTAFCFGDDSELLGDYGWYDGNSGGRPHPVAMKQPNAWGLYDMHGNVWEWCSDWYGKYPYGQVIDPQGPAEGSSRVLRGGHCVGKAASCESANRDGLCPSESYMFDDKGYIKSIGFRVALCSDGAQ